MKAKTRILTFLLAAVLSAGTVSCGILPPRGAVVITDHEAIEEILQEHFPELYELHEQGRVEVDEIYSYTDFRGRPKYKVSLRYHPD